MSGAWLNKGRGFLANAGLGVLALFMARQTSATRPSPSKADNSIIKRSKRHWRQMWLALCAIVVSGGCGPLLYVESQGLNYHDRFDEIIGLAFACGNQYTKSARGYIKSARCHAEAALENYLLDQHSIDFKLDRYLREKGGICKRTDSKTSCRLVREVTRRIHTGDTAQVAVNRTVFAIDIEILVGNATRVSIDRHDDYMHLPDRAAVSAQ